MISKLKVYQDNSRGVFRGISKQFYPRWEGWQLIYDGASQEVLDKSVEDFYMVYYYYQMKLDLMVDKDMAFACLNFATAEGKKKLVSKLQKTTGSKGMGSQLIEEFNHMGIEGKYRLLLELLDHYDYFGSIEDSRWIIGVYRGL